MTDLESLIRSGLDGTFRTFDAEGNLYTRYVKPEYAPEYRPDAPRVASPYHRNLPRVFTRDEIATARRMRAAGSSVYDIAKAIHTQDRKVWPLVRDVPFRRRKPVRSGAKPSRKPVHPVPQVMEREILWLASDAPVRVTVADIRSAVSRVTGVSCADMDSHRRTDRMVCARHVFWWLAHHVKGISHLQLGVLSGGRDHSTVLHGVGRVNRQREHYDAVIRAACATLGIPVPGVAA